MEGNSIALADPLRLRLFPGARIAIRWNCRSERGSRVADLRNQVLYAVLVIVGAFIGTFVSIAGVAAGVGLGIFVMS